MKKVVKKVVRPAVPKISWSFEQLRDWWEKNAKLLRARYYGDAPRHYAIDDPEQLRDWWEKNAKLLRARYYGDASRHYAIDDLSFAGDHMEFPNCCAFGVACELDNNFGIDYDGWTKGMKLCAAAYDLKNSADAPFVLAATASTQHEEEAILKGIGMEKLKTVHNTNSGNEVTLWLAPVR
jgi:hypothetical protein